jgi:hypothetical protein
MYARDVGSIPAWAERSSRSIWNRSQEVSDRDRLTMSSHIEVYCRRGSVVHVKATVRGHILGGSVSESAMPYSVFQYGIVFLRLTPPSVDRKISVPSPIVVGATCGKGYVVSVGV